MRRWPLAAVMLGAAVVVAGCTSMATTQPAAPASSSPPARAPSTGTHWLIAASAITKLDDIAGSAVVARYLDGSQTTIITGHTIPPSLAGWHVNFALDTKSLQQIRLG